MNKNFGIFGLGVLAVLATACKPQSTSQKIENKIEDAGHETGQALERAGENVKDAAK